MKEDVIPFICSIAYLTEFCILPLFDGQVVENRIAVGKCVKEGYLQMFIRAKLAYRFHYVFNPTE